MKATDLKFDEYKEFDYESFLGLQIDAEGNCSSCPDSIFSVIDIFSANTQKERADPRSYTYLVGRVAKLGVVNLPLNQEVELTAIRVSALYIDHTGRSKREDQSNYVFSFKDTPQNTYLVTRSLKPESFHACQA